MVRRHMLVWPRCNQRAARVLERHTSGPTSPTIGYSHGTDSDGTQRVLEGYSKVPPARLHQRAATFRRAAATAVRRSAPSYRRYTADAPSAARCHAQTHKGSAHARAGALRCLTPAGRRDEWDGRALVRRVAVQNVGVGVIPRRLHSGQQRLAQARRPCHSLPGRSA
jgi:hypothetical protein